MHRLRILRLFSLSLAHAVCQPDLGPPRILKHRFNRSFWSPGAHIPPCVTCAGPPTTPRLPRATTKSSPSTPATESWVPTGLSGPRRQSMCSIVGGAYACAARARALSRQPPPQLASRAREPSSSAMSSCARTLISDGNGHGNGGIQTPPARGRVCAAAATPAAAVSSLHGSERAT